MTLVLVALLVVAIAAVPAAYGRGKTDAFAALHAGEEPPHLGGGPYRALPAADAAPLAKYQVNCAKCRAAATYIREVYCPGCAVRFGEHMHLRCTVCKAKYITACADG